MKIGFTGDLAFSEYTKNIPKEKNVIDKKILDILNKNNYNIINFESPVTDSNITQKEALAHKSEVSALNFINKIIKNPLLSIANNHMMDFGIKGLLDTIQNINDEKIPYIGAGLNSEEATNYIIVGEEVKIGVVALQYKNYLIATETSPGTAHDKHKKLIKRKIKEMKKNTDWIVLIYHGGDEFLNTPLPHTRKKFNKFLQWGVDIVIGHHPHVVQGYEKKDKKIIFYSLGNFIFDTEFQRAQDDTDKGLIINLDFTKDNFKYEIIPIYNDRKKHLIKIAKDDYNFKNININYKKNWQKEAIRLDKIKKNKMELKNNRQYSLNDLHIKSVDNLTLMTFNELIKKNYIKELDELPKFNNYNNKFKNKLERLKTISKDEIYRKITKKYVKIRYRGKKI